jgi:hypothetical protein
LTCSGVGSVVPAGDEVADWAMAGTAHVTTAPATMQAVSNAMMTKSLVYRFTSTAWLISCDVLALP